MEAAPEIKGYQQLGGLNPSLYLDPEQVSEREEVCIFSLQGIIQKPRGFQIENFLSTSI